MSVSLATLFTGIPLSNPFLLASAPPTATADMIERAFAAGWGGAVLKTLAQTEHNPLTNVTPRICAVKHTKRVLGYVNNELGTMKGIDHWLEGMVRIKRNWPERALVASMLYGGTPLEAQWRDVPQKCQQAGADALELNFSCPHGSAEEGGLASIADSAEAIQRVLGWVRESTTLPIWVKLPAYCDLERATRLCEEHGAQSITVINTLNCLPGIDIHTSHPLLSVDGNGAFGGLSGSAIKPIALRSVVMTRKACGLAVSGVGGISNWQDAAEFVLAGAGSLQVCTAVMQHGYGIIDDLYSGLAAWLEERDFASVAEAVGNALPYVMPHRALSREYRAVAVCRETCTCCGACAVSCRDSGYQAIAWEKGQRPKIDPSRCDGCGLCASVCPAESMCMKSRAYSLS